MDYARVRAYAEELAAHAPDPFRGYEIVGDEVVLTLSLPRPHEFIAFRLRDQLAGQLPPDLVAHTGGEVEDPSLGRLRRPDLVVVPEKVFAGPTMAPFQPQAVALVAEIVSPSNSSTDHVDKMRDYPAMGIPLYLLVDPRDGTIAVLSDPGPAPEGGEPRYRTRSDHAFGDTVTVGAWVIETDGLRPYPPS